MKNLLLALAIFVIPFMSALASNELCVGDRVVFTQRGGAHYDAVILEIYEDGTARVRFPNGEYADSQVSVSSLHQQVRSLRRFHVGDDVVFTQRGGAHYSAVILALYSDTSTARLRFPNGEYSDSEVSLDSVSRSPQYIGQMTVGDEVVFTQRGGAHYKARILALYEDNTARVSFPNGEYSDSQVSLDSLSLYQTEMNGFVVDEDVVFNQRGGAHYDARILAIYADGTVRLTFPNGEYSDSDVAISMISRRIYCTRENSSRCRR